MNGDALRARLASGEPVVLPGVFDALSARLAHAAGHDSLFVSGFAVAATLLGKPDFGYVTQTEMADVARRVCSAVPGRSRPSPGITGGKRRGKLSSWAGGVARAHSQP